MRIGMIQTAQQAEDYWRVTLDPWENDVKAGQMVVQTRHDQNLSLWEVVAETDECLVLSAVGSIGSASVPARTTRQMAELKKGDGLDAFVGGRHTHLGLGDIIAGVTSALGIPPCEGCKKRQEKLNRLFPNVLKR